MRVKVGCLSDEIFDWLASGSGPSRSPKRAGRRRICRRQLFGIASTLRSSAKQRKRSSAGLQGRLYVCRAGMAAPPSEAESRRSSSLGQAATSPMIWLFTTRLTQHPITRHCLILRSRVGRVHPRRRIWGRLDHRERGVICTPKLNVVGWKTPAPVIKFILSANASLPARRAIRAHQASATVARRNGVGIHPRRRPDESH